MALKCTVCSVRGYGVHACRMHSNINLALSCIVFSSAAIPKLCSLEPDPGFCMAYFQNYFYNSTSEKCELFVYGGCQGNENNFETKDDCEDTCKGKTKYVCST